MISSAVPTYLAHTCIWDYPHPEDFTCHVASKRELGRRMPGCSLIFCCEMLLFLFKYFLIQIYEMNHIFFW